MSRPRSEKSSAYTPMPDTSGMTAEQKAALRRERKRASRMRSWSKHREANLVRMRENYQKHREERLEQVKAYAAEHKEEIKVYNKEYRKRDPEAHRQRSENWRLANLERHRANAREYYENNKEKVTEYNRQYAKEHPEVDRNKTARRRAQKARSPQNDLTSKQWKAIQEHYGHRCVYCGRKMQRLTMDHITPLSKGGAHTASNVVPACKSCNSKKNAGPPLAPVQPLLFAL